MIFVFGSNLSGIHGTGAALTAVRLHGAILGVGVGRMGNSYALPTKGYKISFMPLHEVKKHVDMFIDYADIFYWESFQVTRVGCGLAGFKDEEIAPLFKKASKNCTFDTKWRNILGTNKEYWGTY